MPLSSPQRPIVDLIIAARNVAETLPSILAGVPARHLRSVVVVDNASTDRTGQVALDAGAIVLREPRVGYGAACKRAVLHLEGLPRPPDVVVFMAADGSDDPTDIPSLLQPVHNDSAELVIGVRQREGEAARPRRSRVALGLISAIYRHRFEDIGPFRAVRFPALVALGMSDAGAGWNVEMMVKSVNFGLHIVEVPVASRPTGAARVRGDSPGGVGGLIDSVGTTGRVLFRILRNATAR